MTALRMLPGVLSRNSTYIFFSDSVFTCSKLTIETLEQGVKYVQS